MTIRQMIAALMAVLLATTLTGGGRAETITPSSQAALVIQFGDGQTVVRVVSWGEGTMTGLDLLRAGGLAVISGDGTVCKIGPQGCDDPSTYATCWCRCTGGGTACAYWNYSHWQNGRWRYSGVGADSYLVPSGGLEGWAWGNHVQPPALDPATLFDPVRLAPGVPTIMAHQGTLDMEVDAQGDSNANASASARYRAIGGAWSTPPLTLTRETSGFRGRFEGLAPGNYEIRVEYMDPDGVNGSTSWVLSAVLAGEYVLRLPLLLRGTGA